MLLSQLICIECSGRLMRRSGNAAEEAGNGSAHITGRPKVIDEGRPSEVIWTRETGSLSQSKGTLCDVIYVMKLTGSLLWCFQTNPVWTNIS